MATYPSIADPNILINVSQLFEFVMLQNDISDF